ncbi:aminodeoxychorismate lyase [Aestuariibacter sp. A3R04]|uniref:aminodeoxychorismate lyase n=1 Tax=Aestuariibacter sp. A3R04 TaxID=2841571 RepID=UPI001C0A3EB0|nr:aminodeoxychorismate lyase [Aestuariibacter sp. A3R04]MBU3022723.1 aminodeoxychorismate lyase [Aestuariibacter sp. A3R04]
MSSSPPLDRALQYGDGLFTTAVVQNGAIALWDFHKQRLLSDSHRLMIDINGEKLEVEAFQQAKALKNGVLKIHLSAGTGGRGYQRAEDTVPTVTYSYHQIPSHYAGWRKNGIEISVSPVQLGVQPLLAGIKHLNRLEQVLVKQQLTFDDAIVTSIDGYVIEASASNVFWYANGTWYTPALTKCGVEGVFRRFITAYFETKGQAAEVGNYFLSDVFVADALFLCNALMEIVPVRSLHHDGRVYNFDIQPVRHLQQQLANRAMT